VGVDGDGDGDERNSSERRSNSVARVVAMLTQFCR
jgi:hypothetical protein